MPSAPPDPGGFGFGAPVPVQADATDFETRFGGPLVDTGFGNPAYSPWVDYYDVVTPFAPAPIPSFGNITDIPAEWVPPSFRILPDDGGVLIELWGAWVQEAYRVRMMSNPGAVLYPQDQDWCYSGVPGAPYDIVPNPPGEFMRVVVPPLPTGVYDIVLYWGPLWGSSYVHNGDDGNGAFDVLHRTRQQAVYRVRSSLPPLWKTGPRSYADEELL